MEIKLPTLKKKNPTKNKSAYSPLLLSKHFQIEASTVGRYRKLLNPTHFVGCNLESRLPIRSRCISATHTLITSITLFIFIPTISFVCVSTSAHLTASLVLALHLPL